jgi:hypothetical protein
MAAPEVHRLFLHLITGGEAYRLHPRKANFATDPDYPILDKVAQKVIQKYQTSSCQQLAMQKSHPPTGQRAVMEQRAVEILRNDPQMRTAFINQVAAPIANKLFECGMIP